MMNHSHVLVVGGTGMLADASVWLEQHAEKVSVIGRNQHKHKKLQERMKKLNSLIVDYGDKEDLRQHIKIAIEKYGPITLVVSGIHSYASEALDIISG
ncbi:MAG: short-chain dehydrogenase [Bacillota bacterium]